MCKELIKRLRTVLACRKGSILLLFYIITTLGYLLLFSKLTRYFKLEKNNLSIKINNDCYGDYKPMNKIEIHEAVLI